MNPADPAAEALAKKRFFQLQLLRLVGVMLAAFGLIVVAHKLPLPPALGIVLAIGGIATAFVLPALLARSWKPPKP